MNDKNDLFGKKHATMWRISMWANGLASILFFIFILSSLAQIFQYNLIAHNQYQTDLLGLFSRYPLYVLDLILQMARVFLQGTAYYLVLKGTSLGLDMIVETDINYRGSKAEGGEE